MVNKFFSLVVGLILILGFFSTIPKKTFAACNYTYCESSFDCDSCCQEYGDPNACTDGCNTQNHTCTWTTGNQCSTWGPCSACTNFCCRRYCTNPAYPYDMQIQSCGGGTCGEAGANITYCGGSAWPGCGGACPSGQNCIPTQNAPCRCQTPRSCDDYITTPRDPVVTRISPTEALITWQSTANPYITRMSLLVDAVFGNDPPVVDEQNLNPKTTTSWNAVGLTPGKYYRATITFFAEGAPGWGSLCRKNSNTEYLSSCRMNPNPLDLSSVGQTGFLTSEIVDDVGRVSFGITHGASHSVATVTDNGNPDQIYPFSNKITAIGSGTTTITNGAQLWVGGSTQAWVLYCTDRATVNVGVLPTSTPTPTPTPNPVSWIKLKDTSFFSQNSLTSLIPLSPSLYDAVDDDGTANFIIGAAGVVGAPSINVTGINANAKTSSPNEYKVTGYTPSYLMTPNSFLSYIKARKQHKVITSLAQITADGIYVWEGTSPLSITDAVKVRFDNYKIVLISTGQVNINTNNGLDPINGSLAIIAPTITFTNIVEEANGIFIANNIETGSPSNQGLKIIGNLIALESLTNNREWTNGNKPSLFVVFDQEKYINLLPYLSTANYDWRQIQ